MPLTKPRQALLRSKFMQVLGIPNLWCTVTALDGSKRSLQTLVSIIKPIFSRFIPELIIAFSPANTAASINEISAGH